MCGQDPTSPQGSGPWADADAYCKGIKARLCTKSEMMRLEAGGKGELYDFEYMWTSTSCVGGFFQVRVGNNGGDVTAVCNRTNDGYFGRCCADVESGIAIYPVTLIILTP